MEINSKKHCVMWFQSFHCRHSIEQADTVVNKMILQAWLSRNTLFLYLIIDCF